MKLCDGHSTLEDFNRVLAIMLSSCPQGSREHHYGIRVVKVVHDRQNTLCTFEDVSHTSPYPRFRRMPIGSPPQVPRRAGFDTWSSQT